MEDDGKVGATGLIILVNVRVGSATRRIRLPVGVIKPALAMAAGVSSNTNFARFRERPIELNLKSG